MKSLFPVLLLTSLIFSCQKSKTQKESTNSTPSFEAERHAFFSNLKSPAEAAYQLETTTAEFNPELLNNPKSYFLYATDNVRAAANLGVYLSDLSYCLAYKQSAYTKELFTAAYGLSKYLGIEQRILDFLMKRYNENIARNDSVKVVVNELFQKSTIGLQGTDREKLVGIAMATYQIENLHLTLGILESYSKVILTEDEKAKVMIPFFQIVVSQQQNVKTIYAFLKTIGDPLDPEANPNYAYYATAFEELLEEYKDLGTDGQIDNDQAHELMKGEVIHELSAKVNAIRKKVVSI